MPSFEAVPVAVAVLLAGGVRVNVDILNPKVLEDLTSNCEGSARPCTAHFPLDEYYRLTSFDMMSGPELPSKNIHLEPEFGLY